MITCIDKIRDKSGNIIGYILKDENNNIREFDAYTLKSKIMSREFIVENLKLTSDNRLIDCKPSEIEAKEPKIDVEDKYKQAIICKKLCQYTKQASKGIFRRVKIDPKNYGCCIEFDSEDINKLISNEHRQMAQNTITESMLANTFNNIMSIRFEINLKDKSISDGKNKLHDFYVSAFTNHINTDFYVDEAEISRILNDAFNKIEYNVYQMQTQNKSEIKTSMLGLQKEDKIENAMLRALALSIILCILRSVCSGKLLEEKFEIARNNLKTNDDYINKNINHLLKCATASIYNEELINKPTGFDDKVTNKHYEKIRRFGKSNTSLSDLFRYDKNRQNKKWKDEK